MAPLPETHHALVQRVYAEPLKVEDIPVPKPTAGSAVIKVEVANIISYMRDIYNGVRKYQYPTPLVPGTMCIGRVAALGSDATLLKEGQLAYVDCTIRGRDDPGAIILSGIAEGGTEGSKALMHGEWRDSSYAEYMKAPLENCHPVDEAKFCSPVSEGGLGYNIGQLAWLGIPLVPYGGLKSINLQAGETVVIAPATGGFGGGAVLIALAMGARVIAMGRNADALAKLKKFDSRVETVQMVGDVEKEVAALKKFGRIDAFLDISPSQAQDSTHFKSCILSLRPEGRVSLMGGILGDLPLPHRFIMRFNITLKGKWMYYREDIPALIKLIEHGNLKLDHVKLIGTYPLEEWKEAFDVAADKTGLGEIVLLKPQY
ncbi:alcohol dehydrogenase [Rhizodiscina lignyota]|uniref:Alcohol dehydrogenase n=1 Tax=Rhizodiscina lignyota TaxID=1504668 RepID=A0A9P4I5Z5_9PEZI|nr:alcohol dehydrogenase [Rhizodiscina lignyota]